MTTLPTAISTAASDDTLFRALAVCHAEARPELPERIVRPILAAHRLHVLTDEVGAAHRTAEGRDRLLEIVDTLKAAALDRALGIVDTAGLAEHQALIADLRSRVDLTTTAAREAARSAIVACRPDALWPLLERALDAIMDEASRPAAVMAEVRGFDWQDPAALHRKDAAVQKAFAALAPLADQRGHVLAAVVALAREHRDWTPDVPGIGTVPPGRPGLTEAGHPVRRLIDAIAARDAAAAAA